MDIFLLELKLVNGMREKYSGVEGKVLQAQGLHVAHIAQLYCRVKFQKFVYILNLFIAVMVFS